MIDWKFKEYAKPQGSSDGFWYDIDNGYIEPEKVLVDKEQLKQLEEALEIVMSFERALINNDLINEF